MAKFRRGDLVRIVEYDNPAFLGFEGAVTKVHEPNGGESGELPDGDGGPVRDTGVALLRRADRYAECAFERDS